MRNLGGPRAPAQEHTRYGQPQTRQQVERAAQLGPGLTIRLETKSEAPPLSECQWSANRPPCSRPTEAERKRLRALRIVIVLHCLCPQARERQLRAPHARPRAPNVLNLLAVLRASDCGELDEIWQSRSWKPLKNGLPRRASPKRQHPAAPAPGRVACSISSLLPDVGGAGQPRAGRGAVGNAGYAHAPMGPSPCWAPTARLRR